MFTPAKLANALQNMHALPVGFMTMWPSATLPAGGKWMERNGDILQIADYPDLFAILGNIYGGNGTSFALPDDRGLVERGWDHGRGYDSARTFGSEQGDAIRNITGYSHAIGESSANYESTGAIYRNIATNGLNRAFTRYDNTSMKLAIFGIDSSLVVPTAAENRVRNRAYLPIIKALP